MEVNVEKCDGKERNCQQTATDTKSQRSKHWRVVFDREFCPTVKTNDHLATLLFICVFDVIRCYYENIYQCATNKHLLNNF